MSANRLLGAESTAHSSTMNLQIIEVAEKHRYRWEDATSETIIDLLISQDGCTEYYHTMDRTKGDESQWRVGTTGLSLEAANCVWRWYNDVYETACMNDNRSRGVRAFFERAVLFPRRMAIGDTCRQKPIESTLPPDWAQWVVNWGLTLEDVDRTALLIEQEGSRTLPIPRQQDE